MTLAEAMKGPKDLVELAEKMREELGWKSIADQMEVLGRQWLAEREARDSGPAGP